MKDEINYTDKCNKHIIIQNLHPDEIIQRAISGYFITPRLLTEVVAEAVGASGSSDVATCDAELRPILRTGQSIL